MMNWVRATSLALLLAVSWAGAAAAGIFGVPTNLDATTGATTASSQNPPGWFILDGTDSGDADGDTTHILRLFIEVTGTELDVLVFDPGNSGARDLERSAGTTTTYQLYDPSGSLVSRVNNFNNDTSTTDNRLVRFTPSNRGFYALDSTNSRNISFSGLDPGVYEFRATMSSGTDVNAFGVDIRVSKTDPTPYNVYTIGKSSGPATAFGCGALNSGSSTPYANISQRMVFYPYVTRGCTLQTTNYDMDTGSGNPGANSAGDVTDVLGAVTSLTMSGNQSHTENSIAVEPGTGTDLEARNYGMYTLTNHTGTQQNLVGWRMADWQGWADNPASLPRDTVDPLRMYLPNAYSPPVPPNTSATAPAKPALTVSARVVSGANPPANLATTRFDVTATVANPSGQALTSLQVTIGLPAGVTYVAGSQGGTVDGTATACTDGSAAGYRRCTFATLPAGSVASLSIQVDFNRPTGVQSLTGPPAATASGTLLPENIPNYLPNDTTVWAQYTPPYSSGSFPRTAILGPLCNLTVNVGAGTALATRATLAGLRAHPAGPVEFATGSQLDTVAFNVYGAATADRAAPRALLTAAPVPAPVRTSMTPVLYRAETGPVTAAYLYIEEIDGKGRRHLMGPFAADDPRLRARFDRLEARLERLPALEARGGARLLHATRQAVWGDPAPAAPPAVRPGTTATGVKIETRHAGRVQVPLADLVAQGLPAALAEVPHWLRLSSLGQRVPFQVLYAGPTPTAIEFQAEPLATAYTATNVYVLSWSRVPPPLRVDLTRFQPATPPGTVRIEEDWIYLASAPPGTDPWLWDRLVAGEPLPPYPFDLPGLPAGGSGDVPVRISLLGISGHQHTVTAALNGQAVGSVTFAGTGQVLLRGTIPAAALLAAGNSLELSYAATGASGEPGLYLGHLDLDFALAPAADLVPAARLAPFDPGVPTLTRTDYLIVSHGQFLGAAQQIADQKRRQGLRAVVVDVERVYDRYSGGAVEANAVHALIKEWAERARQRYVLLVGDDTFDTHDTYGLGAVPYVPSLLGRDDEFGWVPSENRYADLDGDGRPDVAIGRLPVQTPAEAAILVEKLARQGQVLAANAGRHLFAVDNQGPTDIDFRAQAQAVAAGFPAGATFSWAEVGGPGGVTAARSTLLQALAQGALTTQYFGHAGPQLWADEGLLTPDDLIGLANTDRETVLFSWACESQFFQYLFGPSLSEALLLTPRGGALASFGPAGVTDPRLQEQLFARVYQKFLGERLPLGEAIRQAKAATVAADPATRQVIEGWNLLGDPALTLPR